MAKDNDEVIAALAKRDSGDPVDAKERVDLGNAWFEAAEKAKGDERMGVLRREEELHRRTSIDRMDSPRCSRIFIAALRY